MFRTAFKIVRKIELFAEFGVIVVNASFAHYPFSFCFVSLLYVPRVFLFPGTGVEEEFVQMILVCRLQSGQKKSEQAIIACSGVVG